MASVTVTTALLLLTAASVVYGGGVCPGGARQDLTCTPCATPCAAFPDAECVPNYCPPCSATYFMRTGEADPIEVLCGVAPTDAEVPTTAAPQPVPASAGPPSVKVSPGVRSCPNGCRGNKGGKGEPGWFGPRGARGLPGFSGKHGKYIIYTDGYILPNGAQLSTTQAKQQAGGKVSTASEFGPEARGDKGERGPPGPSGLNGLPGTAGPLGRPGNPGTIGVRGEIGELGAPGVPGQRGWTGEPGLRGDRGADGPGGGIGSSGPPGPVGLTGERGAKGESGESGIDGLTGSQGRPGTEGIRGTQGVPGLTGDRGLKGFTGQIGPNGELGNVGEEGPHGERGPIGAPGLDGPDGVRGTDGKEGAVGAYGPDVKEVPLLTAGSCSASNNGKVQYDFATDKLYFCNGTEWRCVDHIDCSFHCRVSEWGALTPCSTTCGEGVSVQYRAILATPGPYGTPCPALRRQVECNNSPCTCSRPGGIRNGALSSGQELYGIGEAAEYTCNQGYEFADAGSAICQKGGQFSLLPQCQPVRCSDPGSVENGQRSDGTLARFYNGKVTYTCDEGYSARGATVLTCMANGQWSSAPPRCLPALCADPGIPANGGRDMSSTSYNSRASFFCHDGYLLTGEADIVCQATGQWSHPTPTCMAVTCSHPGTPEHGSVDASNPSFSYSSSVSFSCDAGYALIGSPVRMCQADGVWSGEQPVCNARSCPRVEAPENGQITTFNVGYEIGRSVAFACNQGYELQGQRSIDCESNGGWSHAVPTCERMHCCHLSEPANGRLLVTGNRYSDQAFYTCDEGYLLEGSVERTCQVSGAVADWSGRPASCVPVRCGDPGSPVNGARSPAFSLFQAGDSVDYTCNTGYELVGVRMLNCLGSGLWDNQHPECNAILCADPGIPANGARAGDSLQAFTSLEFTCNENYKLSGSRVRTCQVDRTYTGVQPICDPDCVVADWGAWSACSVSCGPGTAIRTRSVQQVNSGAGDVCPELSDSRSCNARACVQCYGRYGANESAYIMPEFDASEAADVLVVVDMAEDLDAPRQDLQEFLTTLEQELLKVDVGTDPNLPNRYNLVGFGRTGDGQCGHFLLTGSGDSSFTVDNAVAALAAAQSGPRSTTNDGYEAMKFIIDNAGIRHSPKIAHNLIFMTDTSRTDGCGSTPITKAGLYDAMRKNGITPNFIVDDPIEVGNDKPEEVMGIRSLLPGPQGVRLAYVRFRGSDYRVRTLDGTIRVYYNQAQGTVKEDYTDLAFSLGGMMWNLGFFRGQPADSFFRASFVKAFTEVKAQEIKTSAGSCKLCTCDDDGAQGVFRCQLQFDADYCLCRATRGGADFCDGRK